VKRLTAAALAVGLAACSRCQSPPPAPLTLTDRDTVAPEGRVVHSADGGNWALTMPDSNWRLVTEAARARLKPGVEVWVVNPVRDAQLTVQCAPLKLEQLEAGLRAAAQASGQTFQQRSREALDGGWVRGVEVTYALEGKEPGKGFSHVDGLFELVTRTCDVQSWATDGVQLPELRRVVRSFEPTLSPAELALVAPLRAFADPQLQKLIEAAYADGGTTHFEPPWLVDQGTVRLPAALLEERFALRRRMLDTLGDEACAAIVAHTDEPAILIQALNQLDPASAARWGQLSVEAMRAAVSRDLDYLGRMDLAEAQRAYLALPGATEAERLLSHLADGTAKTVCEAERTRLKLVLTLEPTLRLRLYRSWVIPTATPN
jgi:hypothetical protein